MPEWNAAPAYATAGYTTRYEFAAAVLGTIPVLILVMIFQRYIIRGLTEGAVKM